MSTLPDQFRFTIVRVKLNNGNEFVPGGKATTLEKGCSGVLCNYIYYHLGRAYNAINTKVTLNCEILRYDIYIIISIKTNGNVLPLCLTYKQNDRFNRSKIVPTHRRQVVYRRHKTLQRLSVAKPGTPLQNDNFKISHFVKQQCVICR